jgi:hypothetical protein
MRCQLSQAADMSSHTPWAAMGHILPVVGTREERMNRRTPLTLSGFLGGSNVST